MTKRVETGKIALGPVREKPSSGRRLAPPERGALVPGGDRPAPTEPTGETAHAHYFDVPRLRDHRDSDAQKGQPPLGQVTVV